MRLKYQIYHDYTNRHIADIYYDEILNQYQADLIQKTGQIPVIFGFPIGGTTPNPSSEAIEAFLSDRVIPENRDMLKDILYANGVYQYDWKELIKLNKGRTTDDPYRVEVID